MVGNEVVNNGHLQQLCRRVIATAFSATGTVSPC
jgi:hypothetical protein